MLHSTETPVLRSATPHTPKGVVVEQKQCATCSTLAPLVVEQWSRSRNTNGTSRTIGRTESGRGHDSLIVKQPPSWSARLCVFGCRPLFAASAPTGACGTAIGEIFPRYLSRGMRLTGRDLATIQRSRDFENPGFLFSGVGCGSAI